MSKNPLALKIASPYGRAFFAYTIEKNQLHQTTADFQNLENFFKATPDLVKYLANPIVSKKEKIEILTRIFKNKLNHDTLKFLLVLVNRDRINLVVSVVASYLDLVYETASIKMIEVTTASNFNKIQKFNLIKKLKEISKAREIRLVINLDRSLIGGFSIKTKSKIIDFTVKNQLQNLAKHLDNVLDI